MDYTILGIRISTGREVSIKATKEGDLYMAQNLPPYALASKAGRGWWAMATTGVTALEVIPTTVALGTLFNGEQGGGKTYVIDHIFAGQTQGDPNEHISLWACVHAAMESDAIAADITIRGLNGAHSTYNGSAKFGIGDTVTNDGWFPVSDSWVSRDNQAPAKVVPIEGRITVPPQCGLSLHGISKDSINLKVGCSWYEVQLD